MRIYVAAGGEELKDWAIETCRRIEDETEHSITYRWSREYKPDIDHTDKEALKFAVADFYLGVQTADLVIVNASSKEQLMAIAELGAAIAWGKRVWVLKPWRYTILLELPTVEWLTSEGRMWEELGWPCYKSAHHRHKAKLEGSQ